MAPSTERRPFMFSRKPEVMRFLKRAVRQGTWPLLQRYVVARKILSLPAIAVAAKSDFCVHLRVCEQHAVMLHWALRSFLNHSTVGCSVAIHDDGSCSAHTLDRFTATFPAARVISRAEATSLILPRLAKFPEIAKWWQSSFTGIKWIDYFLLGESEHVIFLDTDVLFFDEPVAIFRDLDCAAWMKDSFYSLYIEPDDSQKLFGGSPPPQINSGLGRVPRRWFNIDLAVHVMRFMHQESVQRRAGRLGLPQDDDQTFNAILCACNGKTHYLPESYAVASELGLGGIVAKHYTTPFRFWFYEEGMTRVANQLKLDLPRWLRART